MSNCALCGDELGDECPCGDYEYEEPAHEVGQQFYTNAPKSYDGFGTYTLEVLPFYLKSGIGSDRPFRIVGIVKAGMSGNWQVMRYWSGMYQAYTPDEWQRFRDMLTEVRPTSVVS